MSGRRKKQVTRLTQSSNDDSGTEIEMADEIAVAGTTRSSLRPRKPSQKARDNEAAGLNDITEILSIMQQQMTQFMEMAKRSEEANKTLKEENKTLKEETKELKDMIASLKLDIESMKAPSPH